MIKLRSENAFTHGNHREVYRHPENQSHCLKLMTEHWKDSPRYKRVNFLGEMFRPHTYFNENEWEYQFFRRVAKRMGALITSHLARR